MEGFTPVAAPAPEPGARVEQRLIERWLALVVIALLIVVVAAVLLARVA